MSDPKWVWWSNHETIQNEVPSVTAILETIIAVPLYWWIALHTGMVLPLLISAAVAPLVLLRSDESVALGLTWFIRYEGAEENTGDEKLFRRDWILTWSCFIIGTLLLFIVITMLFYNIEIGFPPYSEMTLLGKTFLWISISTGLLLATGIIMSLFVALILHGAFISSTSIQGIGIGLNIFGDLLILTPLCITIRVVATLAYLRSGISAMPRNFKRVVLCTSPAQIPELIPGLEASNSRVKFSHLIRASLSEREFPSKVANLVFTLAMFLPAWLYRVTIKSTVWVWWPLAFILSPPRLAKTPVWQYKAITFTLIGWFVIINASSADVKFILRIWHEGLPENPFITSLGYFFTLDWSGKFWPVFSIVGPTLSLATLVWLNRTFAKYQTATEHKYEELQQEAEGTLQIIEHVQRVQYVLFIVYCLLVVGQAALVFNSQKCWMPIAPNVQSWSDWLFGDKSPHAKCDFHEP